ncbi:hypothetical protein EI94DRAFT_682117 [Lactarius quietus]|nr:hypothetical protein EI94DRAFT_682117 [Lactarius quietus]
MMRVGRPWGSVGVFWGRLRSGIEGRMVGVRERERRYRGRQCEREPESKEGLVPHPSQPTCWVPTSGFYVCQASQARTRIHSLLQLCPFFSPFPDIPPRPPWTVFAITPVWSFLSALRRLTTNSPQAVGQPHYRLFRSPSDAQWERCLTLTLFVRMQYPMVSHTFETPDRKRYCTR